MPQHAASEFTGYWRLVKTDNFDEFLRTLGVPWVVRKAALKFGGSCAELISIQDSEVRVTSLNAKGSWSRKYSLTKSVDLSDALGSRCQATARLEGPALQTRMEGSSLGCVESWRYVDRGSMVVKTTITPLPVAGHPARPPASMHWYFDRMAALEIHLGGASRVQRQLREDHDRVAHATLKDNRLLQDVLLDWARWRSPADDFIHLAAEGAEFGGHPARQAHAHASRALQAPAHGGSLPRPASRSRFGASARGGSGVLRSGSEQSLAGTERGYGAERGAVERGQVPPLPASASATGLADSARRPASAERAPASHHHALSADSASALEAAAAAAGPRPTPHGSAAHSVHSAPSAPGSEQGGGSPARLSPRVSPLPAPHKAAPAAAQALPPEAGALAVRMAAFRGGRGIASVVPVDAPNDTQEPELLGMSPEQAEETAALLRELELDLLLKRQGAPRGVRLCGLWTVARVTSYLPDYLRVWEINVL